MFIVQYLKEFNVGKEGNEVWQIMVVLKSKRPYLEPGGNIEWKAKSRNCKLERPSTPNQYFFPKKQRRTRTNYVQR